MLHRWDLECYSLHAAARGLCPQSVHVSHSAAQTWEAAKTVWAGPAGYSDIASVAGGTAIALIFESGNQTFADEVSVAVLPK
eukprot:SAG11_NODE_15965_length_561_cov_0.794372_2_plen_81_part_01